jgi:hypothetical protein
MDTLPCKPINAGLTTVVSPLFLKSRNYAMLVLSRNDGDCLFVYYGDQSAVIKCRIDDTLKLYYNNKLLCSPMLKGDSCDVRIPRLNCWLTVMFVERRGYDCCRIGFEADRSIVIKRDDFAA